MYFESSVGVTSIKLLRTIYYYGYYEEMDYQKPIQKHFNDLIVRYESEIENVLLRFNISIDTQKVKINVLFMVIAIGKVFIKKNKYKVHMDEFVKEGLNYIQNKGDIKKIEDLAEVESYVFTLKNFNSRKKRVVIKDFTASFFQHLTRLLGAKSTLTLELANMQNDLT
jgi:hypothetical protein